MSPIDVSAQPVLVYDRIAQNRRRTWILVAFALAALAPFVLGISYSVAAALVVQVSPEARNARALIRRDEALLKHARASGLERGEYEAEIEQGLPARRVEAERLEAENRTLRWKLMPVLAGALLAAMGVLCWGIASSPTSRLLVQAGANPAGEAEEEARRLLENLAIGAGLPVPKLYVIESSAPNAFAAGIHPDHAVIAVTRGALTLFDRRELEGVFAHELSHVGNHDIRLNTAVATVALFLRIPYLMFRREMSAGGSGGARSRWGIWRLAISPLGLYIFFVAPLVASLIRAAVSREREFLADADAALLTRYPDGLLRALAKVGGAGSAIAGANPAFAHFYFSNPVAARAWFSGSLMATHPPLAERIERLVGFQGESALAGVKHAIEEGKAFVKAHPLVEIDQSLAPKAQDELAALNQGNVMGRVYRVLSGAPAPVYETGSTQSCRIGLVEPGSLIVAFDDPGPMRQVNTANQTFGYMERCVKLQPVDHVIPAEVYDPRLRAAAEAKLEALLRAGPEPAALTPRQIGIAAGFGIAVFAAMLLLLVKLGGK